MKTRRGTMEHEWQQGHSSLLRTRPDYSDPDNEIIEEDEMDEWLDRDQVAAICPSCAVKMDERGLCRIKSSAIVEAAKVAGRSTTPQYVFEPLPVFSRYRMTNQVWRRQYGRPTRSNIKRFVETMNESVEPGGANEHLGMGGAIYGGRIIDQFTDEVVAEWEDRRIVRKFKNRPAFEVVSKEKTAGRAPNIGPGVELQGKRGVYTLTFGPSEVKETVGIGNAYNRMYNMGYRYWLRLESPRGKELEFYWRPDKPNMLFWYKSHRSMVSMTFKNAKAPVSLRDLYRKFPNTERRELGRAYTDLQDFMVELMDVDVPKAQAVVKILQEVLKDIEGISVSLGEARRQFQSSRTAAKWETKPKGWTDASRKKFWESLTGDRKHKTKKCMKEMEGKVDDPGAFCGALRDAVEGKGWRSE